MRSTKETQSEINRIRQSIQAIEAKNHESTWSRSQDGSMSVSIPITPADLKKLASLRIKLAKIEALNGKTKTRETNPSDTSNSGSPPEMLTEQLLAQRWHCSNSRLQRWRTASTGPRYLKIGGKVLYRIEDIRAYEVASLVKTRAEA